jgi:hypothetical protein
MCRLSLVPRLFEKDGKLEEKSVISYSLFLAVVLNADVMNCVVYGADPATDGMPCAEGVARAALDKIVVGDHPAYLRMKIPTPADYEIAYQEILEETIDLIAGRKAEIFTN